MICTEYIISPYINQVSGVEQSRKVFHKHIKSYLYVEIYAFNCVSFEKLCAVILFRFQWQTGTVFPFDFLGPALTQYFHGVVEEQKYTKRLKK